MKAAKHLCRALSVLGLNWIVLLFALVSDVHAATSSWGANADGSWNNSVAWSGGIVPGATNSLTSTDESLFGVTLTAPRAINVDSNRNISLITFSNASASLYTNGYILSGGSLKLTAGGLVRTVAGAGSNNDKFTSPIEIQGDATFRNDTTGNKAGLTLGAVTGTATAGNTNTIYLDGVSTASGVGGTTRNNTLGVIGNGANGGKVAVVKNGTGLWTLSANSTFSGGLLFNAGTIRFFGGGNQFGSGTITLADGVTFNHANSGAITNPQPISVYGNFSLIGGAGDVWDGSMNFNGGSRMITVTASREISGSISNGGLIKAGTGTLTLSGDNTYIGETSASNGTLLVQGSLGSVLTTVKSGATLGGNGVVKGAVLVEPGGILAPGSISIDTLAVSNSLTLQGTHIAEIMLVDRLTTSNDCVNGVKMLTYGGTLTVTNIGTNALAAGNFFQIFAATNYAGTFQTTNLPALPAHLAWDLSQLSSNGTISVQYNQTFLASLQGQTESAGFTVDTRLTGSDYVNSLAVTQESSAFTVDTRLAGSDYVNSLLVTQESSVFTVDTRIVVGSVFSDESGAFTIDTRLENLADLSLLFTNESDVFAVDTRIGIVPAGLIVSNESSAFTVDTRIWPALLGTNPLITSLASPGFILDTRIQPDTNLITRAEFGPFTVNTLGFYVSAPAQILANTNTGSTGGKIRFSPDGCRLAKTDGSRLLLWNLLSTSKSSVFNGHTGAVATVEFSPMGDQLLSGGVDGTLRRWDADSRKQLATNTPPGVGTVQSAYASDGARIMAGRGTNVTVYRVSDMQAIQQFNTADGSITAVAICPEGLVLAGTSTRAVYVWDMATGLLRQKFTSHSQMITACAFFASGTNALTASLDGTVRIWDLNTGLEKMTINQGAGVADAVLSGDGKLIASCNSATPSTAYLWDAKTGDLVKFFTDTTSKASQFKGVALSPDQTLLATTHVDGQVRLWNTELTPSPAFTMTSLPPGSEIPITLRSHGLYYFEVDAQAGSSFVFTLKANTSNLAFKGTIDSALPSGVSTDAVFANLGAVNQNASLSSVQAKSFKSAPVGTDIAGFCVAGTRGRLPSEYDYDAFAQTSVTNLFCQMPLANSVSNKIYVLVFAPYLAAGSINATIRADYTSFYLTSANPARGGNSGNVTVKLQGTGITADTTARLIGSGGPVVAGRLVQLVDSTKAWFTFALSNAPAGSYQVEISKLGVEPVSLATPFQVVSAVGPQLQSSLSAPTTVRTGRDYGLTLKYANVGDVDMAAPLFIVSSVDNQAALYSIADGTHIVAQPSSTLTTPRVAQVQILGLNQDGPPGVLPPGTTWEIPLYFFVDTSRGGHTRMAFNLAVLKADSTLIDWNALEASLRPAAMAAELWAALWSNFKSTTGTTWADYLRALDNQANLLDLAGQPSYDPIELLAALFSQSIGTPYRRTLAAAVDVQAPAPMLPLQFSRFITDGLESRFTVGPLGRGWAHGCEYLLTRPTNNLVIIRTPGGGARSFALGSDNVWHGVAGDYATLITDVSNRVVLVEKEGISWQFDSISGQLLTVEEPNHNRITFSYAGSQLTGLTHSAGPSFALDYNVQGRLSHLTDHAGQVTTYEYDVAGEHLLRVIAPGSVTNSYSYQSVSNRPSDHALLSVAYPDNTHQFFGWDAQGRLAEQSRDGGTERVQFSYDNTGTMTMRDAQNSVTKLQLGARGQMLQMTDALGRPATFDYDTNCRLSQVTGPAGDTTKMTYDSQGNANSIVNSLGLSVTLGHSSLGRLGSLQDARGQNTGFNYDAQGNLTQISYPDASAELFGYDSTGGVTSWQNRRGQIVQFTRNAQGQPTRKTYPDGHTIDYGYDSRGQVTNVADSIQGITSLAYDARGFLTSITYPEGKGFTFEYNAAGHRTRRIGNDGYTLNYGYDAAGRLLTLTDGTGRELVSYIYDATGRLIRETKGNGTFTTYTYDLAGQLTTLTNYASSTVVLSFFNYTYDANGNRLTMTTAAGVTSYGYDALNQLVSVTYPGGRHVNYAYDAAGNRTVVNDNGTNITYTVNSLNQYTHSGGTAFGYDTDGNLTSRTDITGTTIYEYDVENRLTRVNSPTKGVFQYTYDVLGNRTSEVHNGVTTRFLRDPVGRNDVTAEYNSGGALVARYDHALGLVSRVDSGGNESFYSYDALGNTREITDPGGIVLNAYDYDAFGKITAQSEMVGSAFKEAGRFGAIEDKSGVVFKNKSKYDPELGRSVSQDRTIDQIDLARGGLNMIAGTRGTESAFEQVAEMPIKNVQDFFNLTPKLRLSFVVLNFSLAESIYGTVAGIYNSGWTAQGDPFRMGGLFEDIGRLGVAYLSDNQYFGKYTLSWPKYGELIDTSIDFIGEVLDPQKGFDAFLSVLNYGDKLLQALPEVWKSFNQLLAAYQVSLNVVRPGDPNDKIGPAGIGPNKVVSAQDEMEYMIRFENVATASAPVQELIVVDYLDSNLDWSTVKFKEIAYGGRIITPTNSPQNFLIRDYPPTNSPAITGIDVRKLAVDVFGSFNSQLGRFECRLTAIDTNTGYYPLDALTGFLPQENGTGCGQGYVRFSVKPKSDTAIATGITNIATIVFDGNDPINTPSVWNIIGDVPSLATTIAYLPGQIMAGKPFAYTLTLTNNGATTVTNVALTNTVPTGFTISNAIATVGTVTITNGSIIWQIGDATNGFGANLTVTLIPTEPGSFTNNVFFSGGSGLAIFPAPTVITVNGNPSLGIRLDGGQLVLFWPTNLAGYHVQKTATLSGTNEWLNLSNPPVLVSPEYHVTDAPPATLQFYRLANP